MSDTLIETVARAIWNRPVGYRRLSWDVLDVEDQDVFRAYARAAIAAIEAAGYRIVPVEVTDEMDAAFYESEFYSVGPAWTALLAAAPKVTE